MAEPRPILLAEDEETDALMFRLALERTGRALPLVVASDGQEAVDYLSASARPEGQVSRPLPALLILDLKMPRMSGFDVLSWLALRQDLKQIPSIVLSSSSYPEDVQKALQLGARDYHIKPLGLDDLVSLLRKILGRWLDHTA